MEGCDLIPRTRRLPGERRLQELLSSCCLQMFVVIEVNVTLARSAPEAQNGKENSTIYKDAGAAIRVGPGFLLFFPLQESRTEKNIFSKN